MAIHESTSEHARTSWSGEASGATKARHRWQAEWSEQQHEQFLRPMRRSRRYLIALLILTVGLFAAFVALLLFAPVKTPLIAVCPTRYEWPLPPNAWAEEDLASLRELDGKTIRLLDSSSAWRSAQGGLLDIEQKLREIDISRSSTRAVILYFRVFGATNEQGQPCLVPPGSSPLHSAEWVPVAELLDAIDTALPEASRALLILDCVSQRNNWHMGLVGNQFASGVGTLVQETPRERILVMTSSGPGERSWSSPDLRGSIFGRALNLGLAGAADQAPTGDGNGQVATDELARFLRREVTAWVQENRADSQTVLLFPKEPESFPLVWSLNRWHLNRTRARLATVARDDQAVSVEAIGALWQKLEAPRDLKLYRYDPLAWRDLEHRLLHLEQLSTAGAAYQATARRMATELDQELTEIGRAAAREETERSIFAQAAVLSPLRKRSAPAIPLHHLALCERFGQIDTSAADEFRSGLQRVASPSSNESFAAMLRGFDEPCADLLDGVTEAHLLRLARRYDVAQLWPQGETLPELLATGDLADRTSVYGDERAHYWVRTKLAQADAIRLGAQDQLFIGRATSGAIRWQKVRDAYDALADGSESFRGRIETALATRDRGCAELPYLAAWLCWRESLAPMPQRSDQPPLDDVNRRLLPLIRDVHRLGRSLAQRSIDGPPDEPPFLDLARAAEQELAAVEAEFGQHCEDLADAAASPSDWREVDAVLRVPLIPWEQRVQLLRQRGTLAERFQSEFNEKTKSDTPPEDDPSEPGETSTDVENPASLIATHFLDRIQAWETHPLSALLQLAPPRATPPRSESDGPFAADGSAAKRDDPTKSREAVEGDAAESSDGSTTRIADSNASDARVRLGGLVRRHLATLSLDGSDNAQIVAQDESEQAVDESPRGDLSRAEDALRSAAPFWFPPPETDPVERLRLFDLQQLLLWQTQRTLDSFLGPLPTDARVAVEDQPFFDRATEDHLQCARLLLPPSAVVEARIGELERLRARRRIAAKRGLNVAAEAAFALDEGSDTELTISVQSPLTQANADALPVGNAAVFVRQRDGRILGTPQSLSMPPASTATSVKLSVPSASERTGLQAVAWFRGNAYATPLVLSGVAGQTIVVEPHQETTAQITLFGDRPQRSSIVFILDCSWSMGDEILVEAIGADREPRLELAKSALAIMLNQLAARTDTRVGVRFYGHRIGYTRSPDTRPLPQDDYAGEIPEDLSPSQDVELVLPLGRFDSVQAAKVTRLLPSVRPWGQSPLYLALEQAMGDFAADDADTDKAIVVITDGANYQFTPANSTLPSGAARTLQNVMDAWQESSVPIYIMGFGIPANEVSETELAFNELAEQTGGQYYPVDSGADLLTAMRTRLGLGVYSVVDDAGNVVGASDEQPFSQRLNLPVHVNVDSDGGSRYQVSFQSVTKEVMLEGGEGLELFVAGGGRDIVSRPFERDFPVAGSLVKSQRSDRYVLRVHRPVRSSGVVQFPISLQHADLHYTRRPVEAWVQIAPLTADEGRDVSSYLFYDVNWEPNLPVPLLRCRVPNWPADADEAWVNCWFKYELTPPVFSLPVADVLADVFSYSASQPIPGVSGVAYRVLVDDATARDSDLEVKVLEEHSGEPADVHRLSVHIRSEPRIVPRQILHQFDAANGVVIHTFLYEAEAGQQLVRSPNSRIEFVTRSAAQDGAWHLEDDRSLTVEVFSASDTLPPDAAAGIR